MWCTWTTRYKSQACCSDERDLEKGPVLFSDMCLGLFWTWHSGTKHLELGPWRMGRLFSPFHTLQWPQSEQGKVGTSRHSGHGKAPSNSTMKGFIILNTEKWKKELLLERQNMTSLVAQVSKPTQGFKNFTTMRHLWKHSARKVITTQTGWIQGVWGSTCLCCIMGLQLQSRLKTWYAHFALCTQAIKSCSINIPTRNIRFRFDSCMLWTVVLLLHTQTFLSL